jgi:hypothetical protein
MRLASGCARPGAVALAALSVISACDGGGGAADAGDGGVDVVAASCSWQPSAPQLTLPRSEVRGTLRGTSRNASTTCTRSKGAGGPEAIFSLRLTERTVVDLEVVSNIDTVVSVRRDCTDPLTELACNDTSIDSSDPGPFPGTGGTGGNPVVPPPPTGPFPVDAAVDAPPVSNSRDGHVRAALDPGTYFVLVDEAEAFGVGGEFVLKVSSSTPPAQSSCATALPLSDGTNLAAEQLDLASGNAISCSGGTSRPALFYRATIPSGHRLTARATPTRGDRTWTPVMQLLDSCAQTAQCLATERAASDGSSGSVLRYVNNGPSDQTVLLAVGASGAVSGALFQLSVSVGEPHQNQSCTSARPLTDGLVLRNQDLSEGKQNTNPRCGGGGGPSLFYKATLLEGQTAEITLQGQIDRNIGQAPFMMIAYEGCQGFNCLQQLGPGQTLMHTNRGPGTRDLIVEVTTFVSMIQTTARLFDLTAKLSLPPGRVVVAPVSGLQTTEAGGSATFTVVLTSPPLQPVEIALRSSDPGEGSVSPTALKFDASNWGTPQLVTVTGVDDGERDGNQSYTVVVEKAISGDQRYAGTDGDDVQLTNRDDEPGFALDQTRPALTSESGGAATIPVTLNRAPTATVRLPIASSDPGEGTVQPAELVFEPTNWNQPQVIRVVGVDDADMDGNQTYQLRLGPATSADPGYEGVDPPDVSVINTDNEYQRVAAQMISGKLQCFDRPRIGADQGGRLYVAMVCFDPTASTGGGAMPDPGKPRDPTPIRMGPTAFVATSGDGGRTFAAPVNTTWQASQMRVAGTTTENAVLALLGSGGAMVLRSDDAGATWKPPSMLGSGSNNLRLAAGGQTVVVTSDGDGGPSLWVSGDGGRTFVRRLLNDLLSTVALSVDATSGAITLVGYDGRLQVRRSTDGGATFGAAVAAPAEFGGEDTVAVGPRSLFSADKGLNVSIMPLDNLDAGREVAALTFTDMTFPAVLLADSADNLVVLESNFMAVLLKRLSAGQSMFATPKPFIQVQNGPAGVPLSDRAVAVVGLQGSQVMTAVEVWP